MTTVKLGDGFEINGCGKPYFIAELNSSHNGSLERAKEMIDEAKKAGCNCVKFQSWTPDTLYSKSYYDENPIAKRMVAKFSMSEEKLDEAAEYCRGIGIGFSSTPYSEKEVDFLASLNPPFIKVASMEINNYPFLKYIAEKGLPVILSTGMADMEEIEKAVAAVESTGNRRLCLLHCVSVYPASAEMINLNNIIGLRERFPKYPVGYSDHTLGIEVPAAAVALGACIIEKHFTLDSSKMGWDNGMAMEPKQFAELVKACGNVKDSLGLKQRTVSEAELKQRLNMRRSIVAARDMSEGHVITASDLTAKRPGTGISPEMTEKLIGKTVRRDIREDTLICTEDIAECDIR